MTQFLGRNGMRVEVSEDSPEIWKALLGSGAQIIESFPSSRELGRKEREQDGEDE